MPAQARIDGWAVTADAHVSATMLILQPPNPKPQPDVANRKS
jgi:hypothetical protein